MLSYSVMGGSGGEWSENLQTHWQMATNVRADKWQKV